MTGYFMYVGALREVFKAEFDKLIERGVPFKVPDLFVDLFDKDPLYVEVDEADAKARIKDIEGAKDLKTRLELAQANIDDFKDEIAAGHKAWKERDAAYHKAAAAPATKKAEEPGAPGNKIIPKGR